LSGCTSEEIFRYRCLMSSSVASPRSGNARTWYL
jgi:hypothetical protein